MQSLNNKRSLRPPLITTYEVIHYFAEQRRKQGRAVTCLQVGANDGKIKDPVNPYACGYGWQCILVEPQVNVFRDELSVTYAGVDNVHLENVAIANSDRKELDFYVLGFSDARWATGLAGFDRQVLQKHVDLGYVDKLARKHGVALPENPEDYIRTLKVPVTSIQALLEKHGFATLDAFFVDTEGYDFEILKNLDWDRFRPELVLFESRHLSDEDFLAAQRFMREKGYTLYWQKGDTLAIRFTYPFFRRLWSSLKAFYHKL